MTALSDHLTPERRMRHLFSAREAREGGVVRRQYRDVERIVGLEHFAKEILRQGYRAAINGDLKAVFCIREDVQVIE